MPVTQDESYARPDGGYDHRTHADRDAINWVIGFDAQRQVAHARDQEESARHPHGERGPLRQAARGWRAGCTGSTQYANANAGLAAFNDPNSAASKFRDYQGGQGQGPTNDLSFLAAFKQADSYYTAADEPTSAITAWQNDISNAQAGFNQFTNVGTGWQISQYTTAQLRAAERQITENLAKARRDISEIVAGK